MRPSFINRVRRYFGIKMKPTKWLVTVTDGTHRFRACTLTKPHISNGILTATVVGSDRKIAEMNVVLSSFHVIEPIY